MKTILVSTSHEVKLLREYTPDSMDKQTTILLVDYLHMHEALEKFSIEKKNIISHISFSRKQLENMKYDLNSKAMNKEDFVKHFLREEKAVSELCSAINLHVYKTGLLFAQYEHMHSRVDSFITTLDTLHENKQKNPNLNQTGFGEGD